MFKIITKLFTSDKRFLIGLILIACLSSQGYSQVRGSVDGEEVILPYTQQYLDQYNAALDKKAAENNATFRSKSKAEAFNNSSKGNIIGACNLITCGSFEKADVSGGTFRTAYGGVNGQYQADARYTCWNDDGTVDWSEGQYISYSDTNSNTRYPAIIEQSNFDGGGFAIFSYQNEAIRQTLTVLPNTTYTVCFEIAVIPRYNTVNINNNTGGSIIEYSPNLQFGVRNGAVQLPGGDPLTYTHANLVQHTTNDFPARLSTATSGNGGNQNPGGWTEINPYWENRCITFKSGPSATSVEVFYKTGNPGRSVVLVDGLRLSVEGYANAPVLSLTEKTYCAPTQVQLDTFVTSTTPTGATLKWSPNSDLSFPLGNNPTVTTPGVWYAFYLNETLGCTSPSRKLTLTNTDLDSSYTQQNVTCFGGNNGSIDLSVTGGSSSYTYLWTTNDGSGLNPNSQDQSGLTAGTYNVTINDGTCETQETVVITQANQMIASATGTDVACASDGNQSNDGTATVTITGGGVAPITYLWSNGATTATITGLSAGTYNVTATDANGCTATASYTVAAAAPFTASATGTDVACASDGNQSNDGTATVTITGGGVAPITYLWSNGATTATITGLSAGTYSVTVTDANGCTATASYTVAAAAPFTASATGTDVACASDGNQSNDGTATVTITGGGVAPITYLWSNGATTATITGLSAGTYSVTATDANGCTATASYTVAAAAPFTASATGTDVACASDGNQSNDGTATVTITGGGVAPITYLWSNGATTATITGLSAGTYNVTATDANGCTATASYTVAAAAPFTASATGTDVACASDGNQSNDGTATVTITGGGVAPITYLWSNGATTATITGLSAGTYNVTATDANGCTATASYTVAAAAPFTASATGTDVACASDGNQSNDGTATVTITGGGVAPITYLWSNGATTATITGLSAGTYSVTATDANGCTATASYTVAAAAPFTASATGTDVACASDGNQSNDGTATVTITGGGVAPITYLWSNGATTATITGLSAGTYNVTATDANGCTATASYTVAAAAPFTASATGTDVACASDGNQSNDGTATVTITGGGVAPITYLWSNGATTATITGLSAGTYSVTVTDANGCTATASYTVAAAAPFTASATGTDVACASDGNQSNDGTATVTITGGGVAPITYLWSNGATTATITGLSAGTYSVTATDANGCTATASYTVAAAAPFTASATGTDVACASDGNQSNDGTATVTITGGGVAPITYLWSNGATTATITGLSAGTYSVTATDANGCTATASYTVAAAAPFTASATGTDVGCYDDNDGTATVTITGGGVAPITYLWSNGATTATITGLSAGTYSVTVTDANGCTATAEVIISQPSAALSQASEVVNVDCYGNQTGEIDLTVFGGTPGYTFLWSNGAVTEDITGLAAGDYTVTITDANGCILVETITVGQPLEVNAPISGGDITECAGDPIQTLTATASVPGGLSVVWYDLAVGGNVVSPTWNTIGSKTYYAEAVNDSTGCISPTRTPVTLTLNNCGIQLVKTASPNNPQDCTPIAVDGTITYTFKISIPVGYPSVYNVVLTDPLLEAPNPVVPIIYVSGDDGDDILEEGEEWIYTAVYTVTQTDITNGQVQNTATVNGLVQTSGNPYPVSDADTVTVNLCQNAEMSIVKSSTSATGNCINFEVGNTIDYVFVVTNEGDVDITDVVITDPLFLAPNPVVQIVLMNGDDNGDGILNVGEVWTFNATYVITQNDIDAGSVVNTAEVNGNSVLGAIDTAISNTVTVLICQNAAIAIVKESDQVPGNNGCVELEEGDVITYTFRVTNEGNLSIDNVVVTDPLVGLSVITGPTGDTGTDGILGLEEVWEYTATYTVTQTDVDAGEVTNQATVNGLAMNPSDTPVTDDSHPTSTTLDGETVVVICQNAAIAIVKESDQVPGNNGCVELEEGDVITYTFRVTNEGNLSIDNVVVTDPLVGLSVITGPTGDTGTDGILGLEEVWEYTATYTVTQADVDAGEVTNQATVNGLAMNPSDTPVTDDSHPTSTTLDGETVVVICQNAAIAIVKESDQVPGNNGCVELEEGDVITYTFRVTNEGNLSIDNVVVTDPLVGLSVITGPTGDTGTDGILGLEEVWEYTATYTITQADVDAGEVTNQATVNGLAMNPLDTPVTDDSHPTSTTLDGETVVVICQNAAIAIVKTGVFNDVDGNQCADAGIDTITYTFTVTNQGNVSLSNITVTDPLLQAPNPIVDIVFQGGDTDGDGKLDVAETWIYTATSYTITQDDIDTGSVTNQATAVGTPPTGDDVQDLSGTQIDNDDATVIELCQNPAIAIVKTGVFNDVDDNQCADAGIDTITYTFTVTNQGNVSLSNITVTDPLLQAPNPIVDIVFQGGDTDGDGKLDVTETWIYTATSYTITQDDIDTGSVTNQATAVGTPPVGDDVQDLSGTQIDNDDATVIELCQNPAIAIVKTGVFNDVDGNQCADAGIDTITYTFTVTNQGNVSLSNITVTDPLLQAPNPIVDIVFQGGDTDGDGKLDVAETWIYTATSYTITQDDIDTGSVTNQATAVGTPPVGDDVQDLSGTQIDNDDATVIELCQNPAIAIVKTGVFNDVDGNQCADAGIDTITYTFTVTNQGNVSLSNITVTDPLLQAPNPIVDIVFQGGDTDGDGKLDVTETWIYTATSYTITQDDIDTGSVTNQATAVGTPPTGDDVQDLSGTQIDNDDATVIELCQNPAIAIIKTGLFNDENQNDCSDVDETITYTFTVTNEGNVSLSSVIVTDPLIAIITGPTGDTDGDGELDVTETWVYTGTYAITQNDIDLGFVKNQATAEGTAPDATVVNDLSDDNSVLEDDPTITELCQNPAIAIVKTGIFNDENQNNCSDVDETITYTFTVTNEGNVSLSFVEVTDPLISIITGPTGDTDGDGQLDVTETWIFTGNYAITQEDIDAGEVINQATVKGQDPMGNLVTDLSDESSVLEDDPTVIELCQNPVIAIVKTGIFNDENQNNCSDVDETITYTFTVTNEGNVSLSNVSVTDPMIATINGPTGDTDGDGELDVTETWIYSGNYVITQEDIDAGEVINQATAEGTAPDATVVSDLSDESSVLEDDPTIIELCQNPVIAIVKTGILNDENQNDCTDVDETISYTFTVTNEGNVSLSNVTVTDPLIATITGPTGDTNGDGKLDVTEIWTYTGTYTITQGDIDAGQVTNQATAEGTAPNATVVSDLSDESSVLENDPTVIELCQNPKIALIKTGVVDDTNGNGCADVDETITYSFTVFNLGNVTLSNITITDPLVTVNGGPITLAPGASDGTTFTATYIITQTDIDAGFVENQATVTGADASGTTVSDLSDDNSELEDDPTITQLCQNPAIALIKVGVPADENGNGCADLGETILYSFSVKNTGNVALTNVIVTDPLIAVVGGPISLTAGQEDGATFTAVYTVTQTDVDTGFIENQATADGIAPNGDMVSDQSDDNSYLENDPTITVLCQNNPSISLVKTGEFNDENEDGASDVGETISFAFAVTNTGNVTLYNITIADLLPGIELLGGPIAVLQPGETDSTTFTAIYAITQQDIDNGEVVNLATATGVDIDGTEVTADAEVTVILPEVLGASFEIYNGITPNGDNMNDFFWIKGIHNYPNNNVKIYNRWGVLVYETDGYGQGDDDRINTFDGTSEGRVTVQEDKNLPTGTYFYILTFKGENPGKESYNGYLYINR
ncbi:gliding motility-associated C-terminal domain-containing protein [Aequorivita nionensis]|uniref:DUF7507 domain-containing protein n=1 Tax=Aequorivita nionensis TaxID=1287690 RepID=UPI003965BFDE